MTSLIKLFKKVIKQINLTNFLFTKSIQIKIFILFLSIASLSPTASKEILPQGIWQEPCLVNLNKKLKHESTNHSYYQSSRKKVHIQVSYYKDSSCLHLIKSSRDNYSCQRTNSHDYICQFEKYEYSSARGRWRTKVNKIEHSRLGPLFKLSIQQLKNKKIKVKLINMSTKNNFIVTLKRKNAL